jgi:hypothetical protein
MTGQLNEKIRTLAIHPIVTALRKVLKAIC